MSEEADPLYRPLRGLDEWAALTVDDAAFAGAVGRVERPTGDVADMVRRGVLLAAAYQSGALDSLYPLRKDVAGRLVRGSATLASIDEVERAHVRANHEALLLARDVEVSEAAIRRIHEVACGPQLTHRVRVASRVQDHVLAAGDYKHHPNHVPLDSGEWLPTAPVALVRPEMARLVEGAASPAFAGLHPLVQGAYLHHGLLHVQPFADGNGRVGRALAGGCVMRAASIPLVFDEDGVGTDALLHPFLSTVDRFDAACADLDPGALARWRAESEAADRLRSALVPAVERALERYGRRPPSERRADLSAAAVGPGLIRVPLAEGLVVEEVLALDAHPLDGGPVVVRAHEARLSLEAGAPLDPWLDRVVSILALRVAAEEEE